MVVDIQERTSIRARISRPPDQLQRNLIRTHGTEPRRASSDQENVAKTMNPEHSQGAHDRVSAHL